MGATLKMKSDQITNYYKDSSMVTRMPANDKLSLVLDSADVNKKVKKGDATTRFHVVFLSVVVVVALVTPQPREVFSYTSFFFS